MTDSGQSDYLEFTMLGCGSSGGVPRIGNDWGECDPKNSRNRRLRCSLLVRKIKNSRLTTVLIDTGPDIREQLVRTEVGFLDAVLYTHPHADHLHGIDDLRQIAIRSGKRVPVFMDTATSNRAHAAFDYCFNVSGEYYRPILEENRIQPGKTIIISGEGGDIRVEPYLVNHGDIDALMFRFENILYTPDVKEIPEDSYSALENLDVWMVDALRRKWHPTHFSYDDAVAWAKKISPKRTILTNMHNDLDYETMCNELPANIEPGYDGLRFTAQL